MKIKIMQKIKVLRSLIIEGLGNTTAYLKKSLKGALAYLKKNKKLAILISSLLLILAGAAYVAVSVYQIADAQRILLENGFSSDREYHVDEEFAENIVNIAVLGFDKNAEREKYAYLFLPDFIGVISINFDTGSINFVRILRDSYVPIGVGGAHDKINHSFYYGYMYGGGPDRNEDGMQNVLKTIGTTLGGIPIQYYVSINMDGLVYIVDALGGVELVIDEHLFDRFGQRVLEKGKHHFSGEQFLALVRHRDNETGQDVGRAMRQFDILDDLFETFRDQGLLRNIPTMFKLYRDYVQTNLGLRQVAALAFYVRNFDPTGDILHVLQGSNQSKDGIYYLVLDQAQRLNIIQRVFGLAVAAWPQIILTDTPPPPLRFFEYEVTIDDDGVPSVSLTWEPGDAKKVSYLLYRDGELLGELESAKYLDTDVDMGEDYTYSLVVRHFRAEGEPANLNVYIAPPMVAVPVVAGMTKEEAESAIVNAGLIFGDPLLDEYSDTVEDDRVIYAVPASGTMVPFGSAVSVVLSDGPAPRVEMKMIPDLIAFTGNYRTVDNISEALIDLGFEVQQEVIEEFSDVIEAGLVIRTFQPALTMHPVDVPLQLVVSKGRPPGS